MPKLKSNLSCLEESFIWTGLDVNDDFVVEKDTYEKRVEALRSLVADLPEENRTLIRMIMKHLTQ